MEHLKIGYYFLVLLVGTAAIVYSILMGRAYRLPFLKPYAWFLGFNNALALVNLTSAYACANLIGFCALGRYTVLGGILGPVARLSQAGIIYALFALAFGFGGRRPSRTFNRWFAAGTGILAASYIATAITPRATGVWTWTVRAQVMVFLAGVLAILGLLVWLILSAGKTGEAAKRSAVRSLGLVYLAIYAVFVLTFPFPDAIQFWPNALALLAINVFPFLWFKGPFAEAYAAAGAGAGEPEALERFCQDRGLTPRECEIVGLLLRGKSNADIEKALFISIHTVKNHITSIHQKLGVRGRWQLISLFRQGAPGRVAGVSGPAVSRAVDQPQNGLRPQ